mgnify:CR=1 FL=1
MLLCTTRILEACYHLDMDAKKKKITLNELGDMMTHVVTHMATKEDIADIRNEMATKVELVGVKSDLASVKSDLAGVKSDLAEVKNTMATASELAILRRDVEEIKEKVHSHDGFAKEIDHTLSRVVIIEKHLGLAQAH